MDPILTRTDAQVAVAVAGRSAMAEIPAFIQAAFAEVWELVQAGRLQPAGPPFTLYPGGMQDPMELAAGLPVRAPVTEGRVAPLTLPAARTAHTVHVGPYDTLGGTWMALFDWIAAQGLRPDGPMWES